MDQQQYVGLDVSLETTAVSVIDGQGAVVWRGKCASTPEGITPAVQTFAPAAIRIGLETGQLSNWLTLNLRRLKAWGLALAKRVGIRRAKVAVARKLAVIMHRVWSDRSEYRWIETAAAA
jgi:hypothetical protein